MNRTSLLWLLMLSQVVACGDAVSPILQPPVPPAPPAQEEPELEGSCAFRPLWSTPDDGAGPVARSTTLSLGFKGTVHDATDIKLMVTIDGERVLGEAYWNGISVTFVPAGLLPQNTRVDWVIAACGNEERGSFVTGSLNHEINDVEGALGGRAFGFDLRQATWVAPAMMDGTDAALLAWHVAPAFIVQIEAVAQDAASIFFAAAVLDSEESIVRDISQPIKLLQVSPKDNPYVDVDVGDVSFQIAGATVGIKNMQLVLGLDHDGFTDSRLTGEVDVLALIAGGQDPCGLLTTLTGDSCHACDDDDTVGGCFSFELADFGSLTEGDAIVLGNTAGK